MEGKAVMQGQMIGAALLGIAYMLYTWVAG
ncbi:hypothetical protein M527_06505 [Sphingobium indicum IP26]|nr:hypothetical protein M527_06505 [Sphingobium indicum IP26]